MATALRRLGLGVHRHPVRVLIIWLLVLAAAGVGAQFSGPTTAVLRIPGQESSTALDLLPQRFGAAASSASAQVVFATPDGEQITTADYLPVLNQTLQELRQLPGVASVTNPLDPATAAISQDLTSAISTVTYPVDAIEVTPAQHQALLDVLAKARAAGLDAQATGAATDSTLSAATEGADKTAEMIGIGIALLILIITYASVVVAGLNILTALVGVGIGTLSISALTGLVQLQTTAPVLASMVGLAVGIDYALLIVTRYRSELRAGKSPQQALGDTVGTAGSAVVTAGLTVIIALAALTVVGIPFLAQMGLAAAGTITVAVLIALTLVPAALRLLGTRALPKAERAGAAPDQPGSKLADRFFGHWTHLVSARRGLALVLAIGMLGALAWPVTQMRTSMTTTWAQGSTQEKAEALLSEHFAAGLSSPLLVLIDGPQAASEATRVATEAAGLPGVAMVTPAQVTPDGRSALVSVISTSDAQSKATEDLVHTLRDQVTSTVTGDTQAYVTGATAVQVDITEKLSAALPLYLGLVSALALVLLVMVFRSILMPLVAVAGFAATVGAAFGVSVAVFQFGWGAQLLGVEAVGPLNSLMPVIVVGVLFGLAMDYQVFLVSRMHEARAAGAGAHEAVAAGFRRSAPVVFVAALIMFVVFAGFVMPGNPVVKPISFALSVGILADAILVRMILVPAALSLLGKSAWWLPSWLGWLPHLDVEGSALGTVPAPRTQTAKDAQPQT